MKATVDDALGDGATIEVILPAVVLAALHTYELMNGEQNMIQIHRVAEVWSGTEVQTSNHWTGPAGSGAGSPRRMVFENWFEP